MALGVRRGGTRFRAVYRGATPQRAPSTRPRITSLSPNSGPSAGGTTLTINGINFTGASAVNFGSNPAASFTVVSDTVITATSPSGTGTVYLTITTPEGTSTGTSGRFIFVSPLIPTVTNLSPNTGSTAGGTSVTISGTNFTGVTSVNFGGTILTPIAAPSTPTVSGLSVASGPPAGGTTVIITGTDFIINPGFTFINANRIDVITPAGVVGAVNVTVTTPIATSAVGPTFTYATPAPTVSGLSVSSGPPGTTVIITGTNFS